MLRRKHGLCVCEFQMPDTKAPIPAREVAARALCRHKGLPESVLLDGRPLWMTFLPEADAVLEAIGWEDDEPDRKAAQ